MRKVDSAKRANFLKKGDREFGKHGYAKAAEYYRLALAEDGNDPKLRRRMADAYARGGNGKAARDAYLAVAEYYEKADLFLKAIGALKAALYLYQGDIKTHQRLAGCYLALGLTGDARATLSTVADLCEATEKDDQAIDARKSIFSVAPLDMLNSARLAELLDAAGRTGELRGMYESLLARLRDDSSSSETFLRVAARLGQIGTEDPALMNEIAGRFLAAGDTATALEWLQKAQLLAPDDPLNVRLFARLFRRAGQFERSDSVMRSIGASTPAASRAAGTVVDAGRRASSASPDRDRPASPGSSREQTVPPTPPWDRPGEATVERSQGGGLNMSVRANPSVLPAAAWDLLADEGEAERLAERPIPAAGGHPTGPPVASEVSEEDHIDFEDGLEEESLPTGRPSAPTDSPAALAGRRSSRSPRVSAPALRAQEPPSLSSDLLDLLEETELGDEWTGELEEDWEPGLDMGLSELGLDSQDPFAEADGPPGDSEALLAEGATSLRPTDMSPAGGATSWGPQELVSADAQRPTDVGPHLTTRPSEIPSWPRAEDYAPVVDHPLTADGAVGRAFDSVVPLPRGRRRRAPSRPVDEIVLSSGTPLDVQGELERLLQGVETLLSFGVVDKAVEIAEQAVTLSPYSSRARSLLRLACRRQSGLLPNDLDGNES